MTRQSKQNLISPIRKRSVSPPSRLQKHKDNFMKKIGVIEKDLEV
jgi:hypothetical protein